MATTDYTDISSPCVCGKSTITVTQAMPDHPWVRAGQISYSATIDCDDCRKEYVVQQGYGTFPYLVRRVDLDAFSAAKKKRLAAEQTIAKSGAAKKLRSKIASEVDSKPSMAAKHRALQRLGLAYESLGTYRKRPYSGAKAAERADGHNLARIGSLPEFGGDDLDFFQQAAHELDLLEKNERSLDPQPVKTGARWLQV